MAYASIRAYEVSFTYDETYTYIVHVRQALFYQTAFDQMGGNHHLLNVWGMWLSRAMFGDGELALRLPNLLAYMVYLLASAQLAMRARSALLAIGCFLLLNLHPYLIDFFSLARGYGLANGFMMLSLWQSWRFLMDGERTRHLMLATAGASLAAMSHVIMVNYLLAFGATAVILIIPRWKRLGWAAWRGRLFVLTGIGLGGLAIILPNALGLFQGGSLNFGCDDLWACMMKSLSEKVLYHLPYPRAPLVYVEKALWWSAGTCVLVVLLVFRTRQSSMLRPFLFGLLLLALCLLSFLLQNALFGVPMPQTRTALFLLPLTAFTVCAALLAWPGRAWIPGLVAMAGCVLLIRLMSDARNTTYAVEWKSSGGLRDALEIIAADHLPLEPHRPLVTVSSGFETKGCVPYYIHSRGWQWLANMIRKEEGFPASDYYLVESDAREFVDTRHWTRLFHSPETNLALYRDERMRRSFGSVAYHARYLDANHAGGRFPTLEWVVPSDWAQGPLLLVGTAQAKERGSSNWVGLVLEVRRGGALISANSQPSHLQVLQYGQWGVSSVMLHVSDSLLPGDVVRFIAWPCFPDPVIDLGPADLWVMR
ncbi:MAG: hypothetical protein IPM46_08190 [Flavobacteriales bacterium]|nr:hypothetical protein [Flavobacteriales bacterium]